MKANKAVKITCISAAVLLAVCFIFFLVSGFAGERNTNIRQDDPFTRPIKANDEYAEVLDAETILKAGNIAVPFDPKEKLSEKKTKNEICSLASLFYNDPNSKLYGEDGFYISVCGAVSFDVPSNGTNGSMQCFMFTKDLEEAGTVYFNNGKVSSVSVNYPELNTRSHILKKLEEDKSGKYVVLQNGLETKLLDSENNVKNAGASTHGLEISGDCYGALKALSMSYDDITDNENLIWFDTATQ